VVTQGNVSLVRLDAALVSVSMATGISWGYLVIVHTEVTQLVVLYKSKDSSGVLVSSLIQMQTYLYKHAPFDHIYCSLGTFTEFRKATISFVMSVRPSICPHGTTWLPLDRVSWNLIFEYFLKICEANLSFINMWQE
jgi:hypothetical protein